jgi:hypothetical protein
LFHEFRTIRHENAKSMTITRPFMRRR